MVTSMNKALEHTLEDLQGQIFQSTIELNLDSKIFVKTFMKSDVCKKLDSDFDFLQWADKKYILNKFIEDEKNKLVYSSNIIDKERMYWIGYIYRCWHFYTGESGIEIYKQADFDVMNSSYLLFHTMSEKVVIDRLKEMNNAKK